MDKLYLITASYDHAIRFWETTSGKVIRNIPYPESQVNNLKVTPNKSYLAAAGNPHIRLFEIETQTNTPISSFDGHTSNVTELGFHKDGKWMFSCSEDNTVKIWDLRSPHCQREYDNQSPINSVALHPNQTELIFGDQNGSVKVWDLRSNECTRKLVPDGENAIRSISVSVDGTKVVAANNKGTCFLWKLPGVDTSSFDPLSKIDAHQNYILKSVISPDTSVMATASADNTIKIWNLSNFNKVITLEGHEQWVWDLDFTLDSCFIVSGSSDGVARLWDIESGESVKKYHVNGQKTISSVILLDTGVDDNN